MIPNNTPGINQFASMGGYSSMYNYLPSSRHQAQYLSGHQQKYQSQMLEEVGKNIVDQISIILPEEDRQSFREDYKQSVPSELIGLLSQKLGVSSFLGGSDYNLGMGAYSIAAGMGDSLGFKPAQANVRAKEITDTLNQQFETTGGFYSGTSGFDKDEVSTLITKLSGTGSFTGLSMEEITSGGDKDITKVVSGATEALASVKDIFGDRGVSELLDIAEKITGQTIRTAEDARDVKNKIEVAKNVARDIGVDVNTSFQEQQAVTDYLSQKHGMDRQMASQYTSYMLPFSDIQTQMNQRAVNDAAEQGLVIQKKTKSEILANQAENLAMVDDPSVQGYRAIATMAVTNPALKNDEELMKMLDSENAAGTENVSKMRQHIKDTYGLSPSRFADEYTDEQMDRIIGQSSLRDIYSDKKFDYINDGMVRKFERDLTSDRVGGVSGVGIEQAEKIGSLYKKYEASTIQQTFNELNKLRQNKSKKDLQKAIQDDPLLQELYDLTTGDDALSSSEFGNIATIGVSRLEGNVVPEQTQMNKIISSAKLATENKEYINNRSFIQKFLDSAGGSSLEPKVEEEINQNFAEYDVYKDAAKNKVSRTGFPFEPEDFGEKEFERLQEIGAIDKDVTFEDFKEDPTKYTDEAKEKGFAMYGEGTVANPNVVLRKEDMQREAIAKKFVPDLVSKGNFAYTDAYKDAKNSAGDMFKNFDGGDLTQSEIQNMTRDQFDYFKEIGALDEDTEFEDLEYATIRKRLELAGEINRNTTFVGGDDGGFYVNNEDIAKELIENAKMTKELGLPAKAFKDDSKLAEDMLGDKGLSFDTESIGEWGEKEFEYLQNIGAISDEMTLKEFNETDKSNIVEGIAERGFAYHDGGDTNVGMLVSGEEVSIERRKKRAREEMIDLEEALEKPFKNADGEDVSGIVDTDFTKARVKLAEAKTEEDFKEALQERESAISESMGSSLENVFKKLDTPEKQRAALRQIQRRVTGTKTNMDDEILEKNILEKAKEYEEEGKDKQAKMLKQMFYESNSELRGTLEFVGDDLQKVFMRAIRTDSDNVDDEDT